MSRDDWARVFWCVKPDSMHKAFPPDAWTEKERRAYPHNPIASLDLCYIYADAVMRRLEENQS